ncbi:hypothetical protein C7B82_00060 [Stenomitos frigidus ULC18]|uniref:Uncharacterized protein n=1 Tax=Stenomitos frigidus ULC18 TaxID=2107698 RepID=A0A2T1ET22_9CYAN|nr:hypothetical protein C7B82_00060 [Stenomitos frigidus ULC18]
MRRVKRNVVPQNEAYKFFQAGAAVNNPQQAGWQAVSSSVCVHKFFHDRVQQSAYSLIPADQKQATHLKIGQRLWQNMAAHLQAAKIFDIVNQLNVGAELIHDPIERQQLLMLNP